MKVDTIAPLVDVQPLYDALAEVTCNDLMTEEAEEFLLAKLRADIKSTRKALKYIETKLDEYENK